MNDVKAGVGATLLENRAVRLKAARHGMMLYHPKDAYVGRSFDLYGEFSEGEVNLFRQLVQPGSVVLDIGANIGAHTLYFAAAVAPNGGVIAYEPQRVIHQMLCANLALNGITNVRALLAGAGRERGIAQVPVLDYAAENNFGGIALGMGGPSETVDIVPVDALGLGRCDLMKIDVEGMEGEVVAGAGATIARFRPVLYVENDRREKSPALIEQLLSLDYELFWHCPPLFNPQNFFHQPTNVFPGTVSINLLCVPREAGRNVTGFRAVTGAQDWPLKA
ncbi:MAG: FkbM family methyltransferase [Hyphomicrobiales bacterium]|nr:FkbM family methyltransferase [Hyphomicrobiales bacterium]